MKGNKILYAGIAVLILGIGFSIGTYAYYQTVVTGTVSGTVLQWNCTANNSTTTLTQSLGSLYPGATISPIALSIASPNFKANYTVAITGMTNMGAGSDHPTLKIYRDTAHASALAITDTITGTVNAGSTATVNIYPYWPYGSVETYKSSAPSFTYTVTCTQAQA